MKKLESDVFNFSVISGSAFNSAFVTNVSIYLFKSVLFINPKISDLLANSLFLIFPPAILFLKFF